MEIGVVFIVVLALVVFIWVFIEMKRLKHKIFAIIIIGLILFSYFSFAYVFKGTSINLKTIDGLKDATGLYISWFVYTFKNIKTITINAIKMDWTPKNITNIK